jgi:hypothetical protein
VDEEIGNHITFLNHLTLYDSWALIDTGALIGSLIFSLMCNYGLYHRWFRTLSSYQFTDTTSPVFLGNDHLTGNP